jgi:hypothetical protein
MSVYDIPYYINGIMRNFGWDGGWQE